MPTPSPFEASAPVDVLYWFAALALISAQGALGVTLLVALRHWRYQGAGVPRRWAQATWLSFALSTLCYLGVSTLPLPFWLLVTLDLTLFWLWVSRAARWAAQE